MPSYDYRCDACGHEFEEFQAMSDPVLVDCPSCGKPSLRRLIGGGLGVIFKGSGFYVNDSRSGKKSGGRKTSSDASASPSGASSGSSESSPSQSAPSKNETKAPVAIQKSAD